VVVVVSDGGVWLLLMLITHSPLSSTNTTSIGIEKKKLTTKHKG
jgi:hypothetical protein